MDTKVFWGAKGEYGPFSMQADGWPNAGEVVRHYRLAAHMSLVELARRYGEATQTKVSRQWICMMERRNEIPGDITRRRALATILQIPPLLLGLGTLEVVSPLQEAEKVVPKTPVVLIKGASPDLAVYETRIRTFWLLNATSHAHDTLKDIQAILRELERLEISSGGEMQRQIRLLLYGYYRLIARVYRDVMHLPAAYQYANLAVRVAKKLENREFIATALYARGWVRLKWGLHGEHVASGQITMQREKLVEAMADFQAALPFASEQAKGLLLLDISRVQAYVHASATDITLALKLLENAEKHVGKRTASPDFYQNVLLNGQEAGLDEEENHVSRAVVFNALGRPEKALEEFESLERLRASKRRGRDQTRHYAWLEVVQAESYLYNKEYYMATEKATLALKTLSDIDCLDNMAHIQTVYDGLLATSYNKSKEVKGLGAMLTKYYQGRKGETL